MHEAAHGTLYEIVLVVPKRLSTPHQLARYLLDEQLVSAANVVSAGLTIADQSRRNRNYMISAGEQRYFIKEARDKSTRQTLAREGAIYGLLAETPVGRFLPSLHRFDRKNSVLVLDLIHGGLSAREHLKKNGRLSRPVVAEIAHALAALHSIRPRALPRRFLLSPPWVVAADRLPLHALRELSAANLELVRILQQSDQSTHLLRELAKQWRHESLIHNDLRWDNFLFRKKSRNRDNVTIVDWELAGVGDPAWDIGSMLSAFLTVWLFSVPLKGEEIHRSLSAARYPLDRLRPLIQQFWATYRDTRQLDASAADDFLSRSIRYAAARLVQDAYEMAQDSSDLSSYTVSLLQLSANLLQRPDDAATRLLRLRTHAAR